jgi:hypothetical protein
VPQIPLDFLLSTTGELPATALEVETAQLVQALKRIVAQPEKSEWVHLQYTLGSLSLSAGGTTCEVWAAGSWPEVISVARPWIQVVLSSALPPAITTLRVENGKLFAQDVGVQCLVSADVQAAEELAGRERRLRAAAAALKRYGVTLQEIENLVREGDQEIARLWGPNDERILKDVADAWQCLASYGVETTAIRRLLVRKSRDLWKDPPKNRPLT